MLDPHLLRTDLDTITRRLANRGYTLDVTLITALETERKSVQVETERLRAERNSHSKAIGIAKSQGKDTAPLLADVAHLGQRLAENENRLSEIQQSLSELSLVIPNLPHPSVPVGRSEKDNAEVRRWGSPLTFDFAPKDHVALGSGLNAMDFDVAAKISGARFVVLKGRLAQLQRALIQFMLDLHTVEHGYT